MKYDVRVDVVNLYTDELGNRELPEKFRQAKVTQPRYRLLYRWRTRHDHAD